LLCDLSAGDIEITPQALKRMADIAVQTAADWVYADYHTEKDGKTEPFPTIDYRQGSLRDDFRFGPLILLRTSSFRNSTKNVCNEKYRYAALYRLRLDMAKKGHLFHIREALYRCKAHTGTNDDKAMFAYVDPANREIQREMEQACTQYLKEIGAWIAPESISAVTFDKEKFPCEATVVIPVRNRVKTIGDAIDSALSQTTCFPFNVIVVDNHSDDGATQLIADKSAHAGNLMHLIPERKDLGIGGCWNEAVYHPSCGRFSVQLDSDDLYADVHTLQKIVDCFYETHAAMVIGAYFMVDFALRKLLPGLIDHREWTSDNGRNNALRINGFGAPRAFYTPALRETGFPNVSYGEDYAVALAISRRFKVGRIYDPVYLCRRWDGNSDAALSVQQQNEYDRYKDSIRTIELLARQKHTG
jgi:hypothetical protein